MIDEKRIIELLEQRIEMFKKNTEHSTDIVVKNIASIVTKENLNLIEMIKEQQKVGEWIPCSERLPEQNEEDEYYESVIVTLDNGRVAEGCYINMDKEWWVDAPDGEHFSENMTGHVIAWMPLPPAYKEGPK